MRELFAAWRGAPRSLRRMIIILTALIVVAFLAAELLMPAQASGGSQPGKSGGSLRPAPDFTVAVWNVSGMASFHLAALRGEPVVVNFWAPWCDPCRQEAPTMAAVAQAFAGKPVAFVGVAYDTNQHDVLSFLQQYGITYPCGPDNGTSIAEAFGVGGLPVTVVIDRQGRITHTFVGPANKTALEAAIQSALAYVPAG